MDFRDLIYKALRSKRSKLDWIDDDLFNALEMTPFYPEWMDKCKLEIAWIQKWYCTDTWVGTWLLTYEGEAAAVVNKHYRKDTSMYQWFNKDIFNIVREHVLSLQLQCKAEFSPYMLTKESLQDPVENGYQVSYVGELLDSDLILASTGEPVKFIGNSNPTNYCSTIAIVQRADGSKIHVEMKDLYIPWCTQENTRNKYN